MLNIRNPSVLNQLFRDIRIKFNHKFLNRYELPWMKSKELDIIIEVLSKLKPKVCFEWGSGYSTIYFPQIFPFIEKWISIEHNHDWYRLISGKINDPRVQLTYVKRDQESRQKSKVKYDDGSYEDFSTYVEFPCNLNTSFDFIFIDGRARKECLKKSFDLIKDDGVVILHDANRTEYVTQLPPFTYVLHMTDYRKNRGGIFLASKSKPLIEVLDVSAHERVWRNHNKVARLLFMR